MCRLQYVEVLEYVQIIKIQISVCSQNTKNVNIVKIASIFG